MNTKAGRDLNLDLIRAAAALSVLSVHFFLNSGFYEAPASGALMAAGAFLRTGLMVCVPLFLMLTGYLQKDKVWSRSYYKGLVHLLTVYGLASLLCDGFRGLFLGGTWSPLLWLQGILAFRGAPYAWYIELYLGLFLLTPFLNSLWRALPNPAVRGVLVLTCSLLAFGPSLNTLTAPWGWQIFPGRWEALYPAAYYFWGCRLRETPPRFSGKVYGMGYLAAVCGGWALHWHQAGGEPLGYFPPVYWNGAFTAAATVCAFRFLLGCRPQRLGRPLRWGITRLASASLPVFLVSWIPDQVVYGWLNRHVPAVPHRLVWMVPSVALVLAGSALLSVAVAQGERGVRGIWSALRQRVQAESR